MGYIAGMYLAGILNSDFSIQFRSSPEAQAINKERKEKPKSKDGVLFNSAAEHTFPLLKPPNPLKPSPRPLPPSNLTWG